MCGRYMGLIYVTVRFDLIQKLDLLAFVVTFYF